jgi:hypothetical protein
MTSPPATPDTTTIVRDLARRGPYCDVVHGGMAWGCRDCGVLDLQILLASDSAIYRPVYHRPGCLWRRARGGLTMLDIGALLAGYLLGFMTAPAVLVGRGLLAYLKERSR